MNGSIEGLNLCWESVKGCEMLALHLQENGYCELVCVCQVYTLCDCGGDSQMSVFIHLSAIVFSTFHRKRRQKQKGFFKVTKLINCSIKQNFGLSTKLKHFSIKYKHTHIAYQHTRDYGQSPYHKSTDCHKKITNTSIGFLRLSLIKNFTTINSSATCTFCEPD
jgi:hypothetical protein